VISPRIVAIVGPTASGKSDLAMEIACRLAGEVISCDSVQVYRGLDVGSGKPSLDDRARVPHHLIDVLDVHEEMNAARFAQLAAQAIESIAGRSRLPIVTGGTGLYLTALLKGLFEQGESSVAVRSRLDALALRHGPERLHRLLATRDPSYASRTKRTDRVRIVRALEVWLVMGRRFSQIQQERRPAFTGEALLVGLDPGREELRKRVTARVGQMLSDGLVDETRRILERTSDGSETPRPLGAIGYREVAAALASRALPPWGDLELQRAIVTSTMQYAKRQMTYFRHQFDVEWFEGGGPARERVEAWIRTARAEGNQT
jgi:tRNA dimethylallyltransferase